jgi:predicted nucleic acid-binding protein
MDLAIPPIIAVDSMVLVWGIREVGPEEKCKNAKYLFEQFTKRKTQVIVPAVALSEYLTAIAVAAHDNVIEQMKKRFLLMPFSPECAALAASLFQTGQQMRAKGVAGGRAVLRADTMIIATAKTFGAGTLYTADEECAALASNVMNASGVPQPPTGLWGQVLP